MDNRREYDIILIGSGIGALTVASLMAQIRHKRILILERHYVSGGFTHSFNRNGFRWSPGLHYVGQMQAGSSYRNLFDLMTDCKVDWVRMPDPFEKFIYPGLSFDLFGDPQRYQNDLAKRFPDEKRAIDRYFNDLSKAEAALFLDTAKYNGTFLLKVLGAVSQLWHRMNIQQTVEQYLNLNFKNPELKAILVGQWGDYGLPPSECPFVLHATVVSHYLNGGYFPTGGSGNIAKSVQKIIEDYSGCLLVNHEVTEILIEGDQAVGVRVRNLKKSPDFYEDYYSPVVISNTGAFNTYMKLIPSSYPIPFRSELARFYQEHSSSTTVSLHVGLSSDPRQLGVKGENYWIHETFDHQKIEDQQGDWIENGDPLFAFISFCSLNDPHAKRYTAEIIANADYQRFEPWSKQDWLNRDEQYQKLKQQITTKLLAIAERHLPGFTTLVEYCEAATPVTYEHFTAHPGGGIYGIRMHPSRLTRHGRRWTHVKTPISGLYQTGSDIYVSGVVGSMIAALFTMSHLPDGISFWRALRAATKVGKLKKQ